MNVEQQIEGFEGRKYEAYPDPLTGGAPWTIGVGHTGPEVVKGLRWTDSQIDAALALDIAAAVRDCVLHFPWFAALNEPRQAVLIGMRFQLGLRGLMGFSKALAAIRDGRWAEAQHELLNSSWARQTARRARVLARQILVGEWA